MAELANLTDSSFKQWKFYKYENLLKKPQEFRDFIIKEMDIEDIYSIIKIIKSSGICVDIHGLKKHQSLFEEIIKDIQDKYGDESEKILMDLVEQQKVFESLFLFLEQLKKHFFTNIAKVPTEYEVVTYLISLEIFLSQCFDRGSNIPEARIQKRYPYVIDVKSQSSINKHSLYNTAYEGAIESSGMILKYFIFNKSPFKGVKRNISPLIAKVTTAHIDFCHIWINLNNILELWKYSDVEMEGRFDQEETKMLMKPLNRWLELNNLISNERFINLRNSWMMNKESEFMLDNPSIDFMDYTAIKKYENEKEQLTNSFVGLYFGSTELSEEINGIKLQQWIQAYHLLIHEAKSFLQRRNKNQMHNLNLNKLFICKKEEDWVRFFVRHEFSKEDAKVIIEFFTFNRQSEDLVDCPFIKVDDYLVMLPTMMAHSDAARALASNFLSKNINLSFKGTGFEKRIKARFNLTGINAKMLYKKTKGTEYECDIAFVLDNELFFVECKSHVQPYTTRQHCHLLSKLKDNAHQLNRIATYFSENINVVIEQLGLESDFVPTRINKLVLTTSMIGQPLYIDDCYIIDESSLTRFLDRCPPSVQQFGRKEFAEVYSQKFDIYKGVITAEKLRSLLEMPPQIEIIQNLFGERTFKVPFINLEITHLQLIMDTVHIGGPLGEFQEKLLKEHFNISEELLKNNVIV
ncbi:hypothetical protein [Bacillus pseudomycoides]|uniref:NERD domain-containing protein n=1 Tax=Bacillus pseudomycoides TaxID=64104 RepID=A0AAJ1Z5R5_9BACI|nr:hypothetical protein [Bacillus pseudomycoides]MDR4329269.1 hypothetical protein [Bacillus pseudomycoides]